ncbi:putative ribonuclease H-like domain-containing protein [Tanacetum coccineum]
MVPRAVLMKSGLVSVNTARQVNAAHSKTTVNAARPKSHFSKTTHSIVKRPIHKKTTFKNSTRQERYPIPTYKWKKIDGGYVTFGGNPKGGKITGKCTIKTGNLDFENMYFCEKDRKFNLCSVRLHRMCDKKNSVLFNDTECIVLSPNFKLIDESQVLLRVPRKNNMYSVDLKNIVPKGGLTCLFAKATSDESKLWHRRLGHLNFKTMNKLVKGNLVRGLPSKLFENDETCVACQKGKQHRASSSKDETSGILKSFITGIENLVDHKVKVIRCDNGTEFKNREMNKFCEKKEADNTACYVQIRLKLNAAIKATVKAKTVNGEVQLQALVDGKKIIITESTVRRDLQLEYADGVDCLPNTTIFEQLTLMGYEKISQKLTFYKTTNTTQANEIASLKRRVKKLRIGGIKSRNLMDLKDYTEVVHHKGLNILYGNEVIFESVDVVNTVEETRSVVEEVTAVTIPVSVAITTTTTTTITDVEMTLAQAMAELKSAKPKADKVMIQELEQEQAPYANKFLQQQCSTCQRFRQGKAKWLNQNPVKKMSKKDRLKLDEETCHQATQLKREEEKALPEKKLNELKEANIAWDDVQAKLNALVEQSSKKQNRLVEKRVSKKAEARYQKEAMLLKTLNREDFGSSLEPMFEHHVKDKYEESTRISLKCLNSKVMILVEFIGNNAIHANYYLLVRRCIHLQITTLHQMFNDVKRQGEYDLKMAFELLIHWSKNHLRKAMYLNDVFRSILLVTDEALNET